MLDIMTEKTLQQVREKIQMQNAYLAAIAGAAPGTVKIDTFEAVSEIVRAGLAKKIFAIGDQLICPWTDIVSGVTYDWVWDIVHMADVELESGEVVPGMYLQAHYATPFTIVFDAAENEIATEETFLAEYSYYLKNEDGSFALQDVTTGSAIPAGETYYRSAIKDTTGNICRYGYNRWSHSAYRQWLNSAGGKGAWWTPQHLGDIAPNEATAKAGFMSGFEEDFLNVIKPVKVVTALNTVTGSATGALEETYDTFFLPALEQIYVNPQLAGEGEYWEYWKSATGADAPQAAGVAYPERITYALENTTSPQTIRLRSANRGNSYIAWYVYSTGTVSSNGASTGSRCAPACVIC